KWVTRSSGKMPKSKPTEAATHEKRSSPPLNNSSPLRSKGIVTSRFSTDWRYELATERMTHSPAPHGMAPHSCEFFVQRADETVLRASNRIRGRISDGGRTSNSGSRL